jgi:hypothetical protein
LDHLKTEPAVKRCTKLRKRRQIANCGRHQKYQRLLLMEMDDARLFVARVQQLLIPLP